MLWERVKYLPLFSSVFNWNASLLSSQFSSLPHLARCSWTSNHTLLASPLAVVGDSTADVLMSRKSEASMGGWCSLTSSPFLQRVLMTDLNTPLLDVKDGLFNQSFSTSMAHAVFFFFVFFRVCPLQFSQSLSLQVVCASLLLSVDGLFFFAGVMSFFSHTSSVLFSPKILKLMSRKCYI